MSTEQIAMQVGLGIAVILALTVAMTPLCRRLGQPVVVGQIVAGVLLGALPHSLAGMIFPAVVLPFLGVLAQIGLALFLFCVGCEIDLRFQQRHRHNVLAVAGGGFAIPMLFGATLAVVLGKAARWTGLPHVTRGSFILFMAVAMSITAVPVLASIIKERGLGSTGPAGVAMSSAGLLDVVGWLLLAVAIAASGAGPPAGKAAAWLVIYLLCMLLLVRPALRRWMLAPALPGLGREAIVVPLVFASAWCTEQMGLHPIFGALLVGVIMPRRWDGTADADVVETVEKASSVLLPVFFVVTGLSVRIGALTSHGWELLAVVCVLAVAGKVGGSALGARLTRMSTRDSAITGVLMNTRGLTELIAINAGRQAGLINETMYTILVLMALVTTALTGPMLALLRAAPDGTGAGAGAVAERPLSPAR